MAKLAWDQTGQHLYETGTDHCVVYPAASDGTYPEGVAWNGLTAVTLSNSGADETALWADDIKYASLRSAEEFGATIEAYQCPPEFYECDGTATIEPGVYLGQRILQFGANGVGLSSEGGVASVLAEVDQ